MLIVSTATSYATHNRAGEITYVQIDQLTIRMKLVTYTKSSSAAADRDSVEILWGDGSKQWVSRSNGNGQVLANDIKRNEYIQEHTYPARGTYTIFFTDPNRIGNILNVNFPNSIDVPFALTATFTLLDFQFQGGNSSVELLQPPIDFACAKKRFIHNPNAYDADGDSLSYDFVTPLQGPNQVVPNYLFPDRILAGVNNTIQLNPLTGDFIWDSPPQQGEYNIAIRINEFRNGIKINSTIRDMQILVRSCTNEAPVIDVVDEICVIAGQKITIPIVVTDADRNQKVALYASGGPFIVANPAALINGEVFVDPTLNGRFEWQTTCDHISNQYYKIVFRAVDNFFGDTTGLATLKTMLIKVSGPPPVLTEVTPSADGITVRWQSPYVCENASKNAFIGFSIWRSESSQIIPVDTCKGGISDPSYQKIVFNTNQRDAESYLYLDRNTIQGKIYCYRILAEFAQFTSSGNPYNIVESLSSNELCFTSTAVIPFLTKIDIQQTANDGIIDVAYTKPRPINFNTVGNPPPYRIDLKRRQVGQTSFVSLPNATRTFTNFNEAIDTTYRDVSINTQSTGFEYQIDLFSAVGLFGSSQISSSILLTVSPSQNRNILRWSSNTAWKNTTYYIYRKANTTINYVLIDSTSRADYLDQNLVNGQEYCYYIQSKGSYNIATLPSPLINRSQQACAIPIDNLAPCAPKLTVTNLCEQLIQNNVTNISNNLTWTDPNAGCSFVQTIRQYQIYYRPDSTTSFTIVGTISNPNQRTFEHVNDVFGVQGCYFVTALDSLLNESEPSNEVCVDNCLLYELPNTFTPNGDSNNDVFTPSKQFFVSRVDMKVYSQWGNLVFQTNDPNINWTGEGSPTGTYSYVCSVFKRNLDGSESLESRPLRGFINLIR